MGGKMRKPRNFFRIVTLILLACYIQAFLLPNLIVAQAPALRVRQENANH